MSNRTHWRDCSVWIKKFCESSLHEQSRDDWKHCLQQWRDGCRRGRLVETEGDPLGVTGPLPAQDNSCLQEYHSPSDDSGLGPELSRIRSIEIFQSKKKKTSCGQVKSAQDYAIIKTKLKILGSLSMSPTEAYVSNTCNRFFLSQKECTYKVNSFFLFSWKQLPSANKFQKM